MNNWLLLRYLGKAGIATAIYLAAGGLVVLLTDRINYWMNWVLALLLVTFSILAVCAGAKGLQKLRVQTAAMKVLKQGSAPGQRVHLWSTEWFRELLALLPVAGLALVIAAGVFIIVRDIVHGVQQVILEDLLHDRLGVSLGDVPHLPRLDHLDLSRIGLAIYDLPALDFQPWTGVLLLLLASILAWLIGGWKGNIFSIGSPQQKCLAFVVPLRKPERPDEDVATDLRRVLRRMEDHCEILWSELPVHYARFVVLDQAMDARQRPIGPELFFACDYDGGETEFYDKLCTVAGSALVELFGWCQGYAPAHSETQREAITRYIQAHRPLQVASFLGAAGLSVADIRRDIDLRRRVEQVLDGRKSTSSALEIHDEVRATLPLQRFARFNAVTTLIQPNTFVYILRLVLVFLVLLGIPIAIGLLINTVHFGGWRDARGLLFVVVVVVLGMLYLRLREMLDQERTDPYQDEEHTRWLESREDKYYQNQMTIVVPRKPGIFRYCTLRTVMFALNAKAKYHDRMGVLGGIPRIHSARWFFIDKNRRVVFISNYDGNWEGYLSDFVEGPAQHGFTIVYSNTYKFPRSYFLIWGGASDVRRFKAMVRDDQQYNAYWYAAHPDTSLENIRNNLRIREGLWAKQNEAGAAEWLRYL